MSDQNPDEASSTQDPVDQESESETQMPTGETPLETESEMPQASLEDTGERSSLQEQENPPAQNNGAPKATKSAPRAAPKPAVGSKEAVSEELRYYAHALNEYLRWKEDLRITSVDLQIGGPYFSLWTKEANLFFRRLVILRKRIEGIKKQKRA